jgi:type VI secretion system protein ImpA
VSFSELLNPIKSEAPAGQSLRYESVYDQIAEARAEDDASLPVGQWSRQTKKADYQTVASLSRDALIKRSKDLWLAVWLGEALIKLNGLHVVASTLDLLLGLQEQFWETLYPEIEDGDLGMRVAPLQWAMERYATLVYELPVVAEAVNYRDYKAVRTPASGVTVEQAAAEALDAGLKASSKAFYITTESQLAVVRESLEKLYLFCDETYRDDGPSFAKIRTAIDEVYNLVASLLRAKRELEPDPVEPVPVPAAPEPVAEAQAEIQQLIQTAMAPEQVLVQAPIIQTIDIPPAPSAPVAEPPAISDAGPQSWEQAVEQVRRNAAYLAKERPASPVPYLLLGALHAGSVGTEAQPPSTELRRALKKTSREGNGQLLLEESLRALAFPHAGWVDLHRYIWAASRAAGYQAIADSVLDVVRVMLRRDGSIANSVFDDDTPVASQETKEWIEAEKIAPAPEVVVVPEKAAPAAAPITMRVEEQDVSAEAEVLATKGDLLASVQLLMQDAAANGPRRISFQRRLQVARLSLSRGQKTVASHLLRQLLVEADEYRLELWEGPPLVGEVIAMLLQALDEKEESKAEGRSLIARLCQIDPARALSLQAQA